VRLQLHVAHVSVSINSMAMARLLLPVCLFLVEMLEATVAVGDHVAQRLMRRIADDASAAHRVTVTHQEQHLSIRQIADDASAAQRATATKQEQHLLIRSGEKRSFQHKIGAKHSTHVMALVDAWGGTSHKMNSIQVPSQPQVVIGNPNTAATAMVPSSGVPVAPGVATVPLVPSSGVPVAPGVATVPLVASSAAGQPAGLQPMAPQAWQMASTLPTAAAGAAPPQGGPLVVPTPNATSPNVTNSGNSQDSNPLFRVLFIVAVVGIGLGAVVLYYIATTGVGRPLHIIDQIKVTNKDKEALQQSKLQKSKIPSPYDNPRHGCPQQQGYGSDTSEDEKITLPEPEGEAGTKPNSQANGSGASGSVTNGTAHS